MAEYTREQLIKALRKADSAGDKAGAARIASMIKAKAPVAATVEAAPAVPTEIPVAAKDPSERTLAETASMFMDAPEVGAAETGLSFLTGAVAEPISGLAGLLTMPFVGAERAAGIVKGTQEALTYKPKTKKGKQLSAGIGAVLGPVASGLQWLEEGAGEIGYRTGSEEVAALASAIPALAAELVGAKLARRAPEVAPEYLDESGKLKPEVRADLEKYGATADPAQLERQARFQEFGIKPTAGELAQDIETLKPERFLLESTQDEAGAGMRAFKKEQSQTLRTNVNQMVDDLGIPADTGQAIKEALTGRKQLLKSQRKAAYDALSETTSGNPIPIMTDRILSSETMPDAGDLRDIAAIEPQRYQALTNLLTEFGVDQNPNQIEALAAQGIDITPLNLSNFERFRKRLNNIQKGDQSGQMGRVVGPIKNALDEEIGSISLSLELSGNTSVAQRAKDARLAHAAFKTEFDPKAMSEQLIANKAKSNLPGVEESQVYSKIATKSTPVEQVDRIVTSLIDGGPNGIKALGDLQSKMLLDLMDSGFQATSRTIDGERIFGGAAFQKRYTDMSDKFEVVFRNQPGALAKIKKLNEVAKDLTPPSGAVPKGSAGFFIDSLRKMRLFEGLAVIPGGRLMGEAMVELGSKASNRVILDKSLDASPALKTTAEMIASDYPALGAALGIGYLVGEENDSTEE